MSISRGHASATLVAFAIAVGMATPSWAAAPSSSGATRHESPPDVAHKEAKQAVADRPVMRTENADYESAVKACKKLPVSERTTCISQAGNSAKLAGKARKEVGAGR